MILKLLLVFCLVVCQAMDKHLICKDVNNVFTPAERILPPRHGSVRGFPGKAGPEGPRGIKGETGAPGAKAIVDYDRINAEIDEKIQPVTSGLGNLEQACEVKMKNLTSKMKTESDGLYSVISKMNGSLARENVKIEIKLERLNATMEKMTSGLSELEKTSDAKIENLTTKMKTESDGFYSAVSKLNGSLSDETTKIDSQLERFNATMEKKIQEFESAFDAKLDDIVVSLVSKEKTDLVTGALKRKGLCDVQYNNSCFWAIVHDSQDVKYAEAERLCKKSGGQVADIYDQQHYETVMKYIRTMIPSSTSYIYIWIATKYNPMTRVATARNGGQAYDSWRPDRPFSGSSYSSWTAVVIKVRRQQTSDDQGMVNWGPTWSIRGVVCEI